LTRKIFCLNGAGGADGTAYKAVFRTVSDPTAWRGAFTLRGATHVTDPPASPLLPPFRGPLTVTLGYTAQAAPDTVLRPGLIRDCITAGAKIFCKEP